MPQKRIGTRRNVGPGPSGDPAAGATAPVPVYGRPASFVDTTVGQEPFRFNPSVPDRKWYPDAASVVAGTPIGAAGVHQYHQFPKNMMFFVDDERKFIPAPSVTQAVRRSLFQQYQGWHYQFHINPDWGRKNGRYPRFSFINLIADTGASEQNLNKNAGKRKLFGIKGQRAAQRFTKVLNYPRQDASPDTYGLDGGYAP